MSYNFLLQKANELYSAGALDQAEQLYRQILVIAPEHPDVLNMLGLIAQAKADHTLAIDLFYQAIEKAPNHWPIYFNLAVSQAANGKFHAAISAYEKVLELRPDLKEAFYNLGNIYEKLGYLDVARQNYLEALKLDPQYLEPAVCLAVLDHDHMRLKKLSRDYPNSPLPLYYLASEAFNNGDWQNALQLVSNARNMDKESPEINLLLAKVNLKLKKNAAASQALYRVLKCWPDNKEALLNLAILERNEAFFKRAIDLEPDNSQVHTAYADYLSAQNRILEALEEYRKAVVLDPGSPQISNNLALILKDMGEYEQALDLFFNAFLKNQDMVEISQNIAQTLTLLQTRNPDRAMQIARNWVNTAPKNLWALQTLAFFEGRTTAYELLYNERMFDSFAGKYETTMQDLKYAAVNVFEKIGIKLIGRILDLGCGTGLVAQALKSPDNVFTGVDLSQNMLDIAAKKGVYQNLIKSDIGSFVYQNRNKYDYVTAFDVFNYLKSPYLLWQNLAPARLIFTIENAAENVSESQLMPNGRYQHNPAYILRSLQEKGYSKVKTYPLIIREECGLPVYGTLFVTF